MMKTYDNGVAALVELLKSGGTPTFHQAEAEHKPANLTNFEKVMEFHDAFGSETSIELRVPDEETVRLRWKLIEEETDELCKEMFADWGQVKAPEEVDLVNTAKELADILYVVYGMADVYGIPLDDVFAEVHRSNMSKLGPDGKPIFREDGKILKGPDYSPADIKKVLGLE